MYFPIECSYYMCLLELSTKLIVGCKDGSIVEIEAPKEEDCDTTETFLKEDLVTRKTYIKMMEFQKPQKDEDDF